MVTAFCEHSDLPPEDAIAQVKMAYKLETTVGKAIYAARRCAFGPIIVIVKEVLGFRWFSFLGNLTEDGEAFFVLLIKQEDMTPLFLNAL